MAGKPQTTSGKPKVRLNVMIDPELKQQAIAAGVNFSELLEAAVKAVLATR